MRDHRWRALAAALPVGAALAGTDVEILETRVYGTNSTRANIAKVVSSLRRLMFLSPAAASARHRQDGGHRAQEDRLHCPTICSNCSAATAIAVVYNDDGFARGLFVPQPTRAHLHQPQDHRRGTGRVLEAGVGDALSTATRGRIRHERRQPRAHRRSWHGTRPHRAEPLFTYGVQGLEDVPGICRARPSSRSRSTSLSTRAMSRT